MPTQSIDHKPHALVVGGTGMLKGVCRYLAQNVYQISVIARHTDTLNTLAEQIGVDQEQVNKLALDWNDSSALKQSILKAIERFGPISLTVAWIHSTAPKAPLIVAGLVEGDFYHVRSASVLDAKYHDPVDVDALSKVKRITYHQVVLGSKREEGGDRWLSNDEISDGVIEAIKSGAIKSVVGT